jgi:hypothetical protein
LPKPKPLTNPYSAQASKNTTGMPLTAPGGGPTVTPYVPQTAPVVATVQKPPAGTAPPAAPGDTQSVFDLSTDPIVQKIRALNTQQYGAAVAQTDAARKQTLINAGFGDLARAAQFGGLDNAVTGDQATALAAEANPYSIAKQLSLAHDTAQHGIDQNTNLQNLFYSSARGNQLGDEAHAYLGNVSSAEGQVRQQLTDLVSGLLSERNREQSAEADALSTASANAIQAALASGQIFAGYDANGNPVFKNPAAATAGAAAGGDAAAPGSVFAPPAFGPDGGYAPAGTAVAPNMMQAPGGGVYQSAGGKVAFQSKAGKYGNRVLY